MHPMLNPRKTRIQYAKTKRKNAEKRPAKKNRKHEGDFFLSAAHLSLRSAIEPTMEDFLHLEPTAAGRRAMAREVEIKAKKSNVLENIL